MSAEFVEDRNLTAIRIVDEGEIVEFEQKNGKMERKPCVGIVYADMQPGDPTKWTLNNKSRNALIDIFGKETRKWINQVVEITLAGEDKYRHITVDRMRTKPAAAQSTIEEPAAAAAAPPAAAPPAAAPPAAPAATQPPPAA